MNRQTFDEQFDAFQEMSRADGRFVPKHEDQFPVLDDDTENTSPHICWDYLLHVSWAARQIAMHKPKVHLDIGSYVYLAGIVSAFVPVIFYDVRPLPLSLPNLECKSGDLTKMPLPDNSVESISALHMMEHIGLARYGDTLDARGDLKAVAELCRVLAPGGKLLMVLPMNEQPRVCFNAHRLYSLAQVRKMFEADGGLRMLDFKIIYQDRLQQPEALIPPDGTYTGCFVFSK